MVRILPLAAAAGCAISCSTSLAASWAPTISPGNWPNPTTSPTKSPTTTPSKNPAEWESTPTTAPTDWEGKPGQIPDSNNQATAAPTRTCVNTPSGVFSTCNNNQLWAYNADTLFMWPTKVSQWSAVCSLRTSFCCVGNREITVRLGLYLDGTADTPGKLLIEAAPVSVQCSNTVYGESIIETDLSTYGITLIPGATYWVGAVFPSSVAIRNRFRSGSEPPMLAIDQKYKSAMPSEMPDNLELYDRKTFVLDMHMTIAQINSPNVAPKYENSPMRFYEAPDQENPTEPPGTGNGDGDGDSGKRLFTDKDEFTLYALVVTLVMFVIIAMIFVLIMICSKKSGKKNRDSRRDYSTRRRHSSNSSSQFRYPAECESNGHLTDHLTGDEYAYYLQQQQRRESRRVSWAPSLGVPPNTEHAMSRT